MKRTTAQRLLIASGTLALLGGGACYLSLNPPAYGDHLSWAITGGLSGLGALVIAAILGIIGLIGLARSGRTTDDGSENLRS